MNGSGERRSGDEYDFMLSNGNGGFVVVLDGDKILKARRTTKERAGGNGFGISLNNVGFTLNTIDRHGVAVFRNSQRL